MSTQDAKKTGNNHSTLLDSLIEAAEKAAPKAEKSTFADSCIKIASVTPPTLQETLQKMASQVTHEKRMRKQAQMELDSPPADMGAEPDFDGMAGGAEPPMDEPMAEPMDEGGNVEDAKQALADALIALCGGVDQAMDCLQGGGEGLGEDLEEIPEDDMPADDVIPDDMLDSGPEEMPKPMEQDPMEANPMDARQGLNGQPPAAQPTPMQSPFPR